MISRRLVSGLWIPVAAFLLTWLISLTPPYQRLNLWLGDAQQRLVAPTIFFQDALLVDLDDTSLVQLQSYFGAWPYERDAYAVVLDYLTEMGAEAVVFDIVLTDSRSKDDIFARSLQRNGNAVLIANAPARGVMDERIKERLQQFAWRVPSTFPSASWPTLLMPTPALTNGLSNRIQLGMVSVVEDADGVLRHLPLMYDIDGILFPSLTLATLARAQEREIFHDSAHRLVRFGASAWPVDNEGRVHIAFPQNANAVLTMPFQQVAEAALGLVRLDNASEFFKGKTVFIGSTANFSDRVVTPRGPMSGTLVLAIAHQSLKHNLLLTPQHGSWNTILIALGLLPSVLATIVFSPRPRDVALSIVGAIVSIYAINLLLLSRQQESVLLFPLLLVVTGSMLWMMRHQIELRLKNAGLLAHVLTLKQENVELEAVASTDSLTGLLLRSAFLQRVIAEIERSRRQGKPLSVAILDLDHFKKINDTYGHPVGDMVLKTFAAMLLQNLRTIDIAGRWGGEEFVVLLPETSSADALVVIDRIRVAIGMQAYPAPVSSLKVTLSAGITEFDGKLDNPEDIVGHADKALYEAKASGRNRICIAGNS